MNDKGQSASIPGDETHEQIPSSGPISIDTLVAEIARRRDEFERLLHVPRDAITLMKRAGIFRAGTPRCFGGDALPPAEFMRMLERISAADGSAGWVAAFGSANTYLAALPLETQREIYAGGPDQVFAGGLYPLQAATAVSGGWSVTGRWHFASGCIGADWIGVGIGAAGRQDGTAVQPLVAVFPAAEVEIVENWDVVGMQGTGSHDLRLNDKFVDRQWTFARGAAALIDEPLFRYPPVGYQAGVHAVVNIGIARTALDMLAKMADGSKTITGAPRLGDRAYFRIELGKAEAKWRSARAFFYESSERVWDLVAAGKPVPAEQANLIRLSATFAAHTSADVTQQAYRLAGIAAIYNDHPLQRLVRDSMVVTQHGFLGESTYDGAGAIFAGIDPVVPYP
jgi:alkylation response protein AidB-like acyl-CoA dehydrogenase